MVQLASRMNLKREAARRWVNSFEEVSGQPLRDPETENYVVPLETVEVLVAAKELLDTNQVDSRVAALRVAQNELAQTSEQGALVTKPVEPINELLNRQEALLLAIMERLGEQEARMPEKFAEQYRSSISEALRKQGRAAQQAAAAAVSDGVNKAVMQFEAKMMQRVNRADERYEQAVTQAAQQVSEASTRFQEAAKQASSRTSSLAVAAQLAGRQTNTFMEHMGSTLAAIQKRSFWRLAPLAVFTMLGLTAGTLISMSVMNAGWQWTAVVTGSVLAIALFVYWVIAVIHYRYF